MKHFRKVFDLFLYQSIFILIFGSLLFLLKDPIYPTLFTISICSASMAAILGITGQVFNLFIKEPEDF